MINKKGEKIKEKDKLLLKNLNLLYVEDNERVLDEIKLIFSNIFNEIFVCKNGQIAIDTFKKNHIDIIISDISMPIMNGIEMVKEIRKFNKKISIIFLTAHTDKEFLLEALNLQIDGYITKPINFKKIFGALSNILERYELNTAIKLTDDITYNLHSKKLFNKEEEIFLGNKEHLFLKYMILNSNRSVTKDEIATNVWIFDEMSDSALKNLIYHLRKKISKDFIENIVGQGYKINLYKN